MTEKNIVIKNVTSRKLLKIFDCFFYIKKINVIIFTTKNWMFANLHFLQQSKKTLFKQGFSMDIF